MDECVVNPANAQTPENFIPVDLDELFGEMAEENQAFNGSADNAPEAMAKDVTDMTSSEFNRFLDAAPTFFPDELFNPIQIDVEVGQQDGVPQDVNEATDEPMLKLPELSPDTMNQIIGSIFDQFNTFADTPNEIFGFPGVPQAGTEPDMPAGTVAANLNFNNFLQAEPGSKLPGDAAADLFNFTSFSEAKAEPSPTASLELVSSELPVQQPSNSPPGRTYPPLPDESLGLPYQSGPYLYPTPWRNSSPYFKHASTTPTNPHSVHYAKGPGLAQYVPQFPDPSDPRVWPGLTPVKASYAQAITPKQGHCALPAQVAPPQIPHDRSAKLGLGILERPQDSIGHIQSAVVNPIVELSSPESQVNVSLGSSSSSETSPDHPVVQRRKTSKPQLPKSLASNYYRIYREDENVKRAKIRGDNPGKQINPRTEKILAFKPEEHYATLKRPPKPWDIFRYTDQGELQSNEYYSAEEIRRFLYENPQHKKKGLILWIQRKPADCGRRYPNYASQRCRFKKCAARHNLIGSGQYRVAFDQMSPKGKTYDPHYNAGYVHLYCLERFLDFPKICRDLIVRAEDRKLPEEPKQHNNMALSLKQEVDFANSFVARCKQGEIPALYPHYRMPNRPHHGTLCHALSTVKLEFEPKTAKNRRIKRGTKTAVEMHMGDLVRETELSTRGPAAKKGQGTKLARRQKRKRDDEDSESEDEGVMRVSEAQSERPQKRPRRQVAETAMMVAPQAAETREPDPLAGPMTKAKKRSIDEEAESPSTREGSLE